MSPFIKHGAGVVRFLLWNLTPPEFAHETTIKLLRAYQALWLEPRERLRAWLLAVAFPEGNPADAVLPILPGAVRTRPNLHVSPPAPSPDASPLMVEVLGETPDASTRT
jgi:hypothetical protein